MTDTEAFRRARASIEYLESEFGDDPEWPEIQPAVDAARRWLALAEGLRDYLETKDHLYQCAAYSEGQTCCLEKPEVLEAIGALAAITEEGE